jgi:NAD(P)H dehydrogenase (quinone)
MKVLIVFYSAYGHIHAMANAIAEGVAQVKGANPQLRRVPETLPEAVVKQTGIFEAQKAFADVLEATVDELATADAIIFGAPTRFGNMCGQMRQFLDGTGALWQKGSLVGKVGSVFTSSATQHGGQESTILSFHTTCSTWALSSSACPILFKGR